MTAPPAGGSSAGRAADRRAAEQVLRSAVLRLGLSFTDCVAIVRFDPAAETAFWRYDPRTGGEAIHVGPTVTALGTDAVEMVVRHEVLHRSLFNGFGERYDNRALANLTLDVCINRLLYEAYPEKMRALSTAIYGEAARRSEVALADCAADPAELPPHLADLWRAVWQPTPDGRMPSLNPASLYYRLLRLESPPAGDGGGDGPPDDGSNGGGRRTAPAGARPSAPMERAVDATLDELNRRFPGGSDLAGALDVYSVSPVRIGTSRVEAFVRSLRLRRIADATARKVREPLERTARLAPYPLFPTRLGLVYQLVGLDELLHLYWNRDVREVGARLAVGLYLDVSGSMVDRFPVVAGFVDALRDLPLRLRVFDTAVREESVEALARGEIPGGGGTDFDAPIDDFVRDDELEAGVLFTDGEASVSAEAGDRLRRSRKRLYAVYLVDSDATPTGSDLDRYAADRIVVPIEP